MTPTPQPSSSPNIDHSIYLDVLRGLAILMVFFVHVHGATFGWNQLPLKGYFPDFTQAATLSSQIFYPYVLGGLGVTLFFVLSGYCIHGSLLAYEKRTAGAFSAPTFLKFFFLRRFFRIYPIYLVAVVYFGFLHARTALTSENLWPQLLSHLFLVHNASDNTFTGINGAFWSLAYEWQLYCIYPAFLILRKRLGIERAFTFVAIGSLLYSLFASSLGPELFCLATAVIQSRYALVWFLGVYVCDRHARGERAFPRSLAAFGCAVVFGLFASQFGPLQKILWEIFGFIFAWLLELYRDRTASTRWERALAWIGVVSYSLYLFHSPLIETLLPLLRPLLRFAYPYNQMTLGALLMLIPLLLLSWCSYQLVERPFHNLGVRLSKRYSGRKSQPQSPAPAAPAPIP